MSNQKVVAVVGGAGAMGRVTVRDLVETASSDIVIVIADYNEKAAKALAKTYKARGVRAVQIDARKPADVAKKLKGAFALINCAQHDFNLPVMQAALKLSAHYLDLGGLFHFTRQQLKLHAQFKKAKRLALLGIGAAPGVMNVLARKSADELETVSDIHCYVGGTDSGESGPGLEMSYSAQTVIEEASTPAALFTGGKWTFVTPMSGTETVHFPKPVGTKRPSYTIHSEVATLPASYKHKGVLESSFRIAFPQSVDTKLRLLQSLGLLSTEPLRVGKGLVVPRDVVLSALNRLRPAPSGPTEGEYEVLRVVVRGTLHGERVEDTLDCHCSGLSAWGIGTDLSTGSPPSICAQLLASGEITEVGALPPEKAVPVEPFVRELARRQMPVEQKRVYLEGARAHGSAA